MGIFSKNREAKKAELKKPEAKKPPKAKKAELNLEIGENDSPTAIFMAYLLEKTGRIRAQKLLSLSVLFNIAFACAFIFVFYYGVMYKQDVYFAATPDGRMQELPPLSEPYVSVNGVSNWTAQAITETYSLDFRNYPKTLARVKDYYSKQAWKEISEQIQPFLESLDNKRLVISAVADEAPRLLAEGVYQNMRYCWKLEFPLTLTFQIAGGTETYRWLVQVLVSRANVMEKPEGLEILQFVVRTK